MNALTALGTEFKRELTQNILPFHIKNSIDREQGGFYGLVCDDNSQHKPAPKGLVQHSRMLWTYAHAYRLLGRQDYRDTAAHAYQFLQQALADTVHGGFYWLVDGQGRPFQTEKYVYGHAFAIYGFSEYALATGDKNSLETAVALYHLLETKAADRQYGGYFDIFSSDWQQRLAENVDEITGPVAKTMNTHLHVLEAYTNLLRAWPNARLQKSLHQLIRLHLDQIINRETGHLHLHFTADWQSVNNFVSYGHDIEASWLLVEAAEVSGDADLLAACTAVSQQMAQICYDEGLDSDGGLPDGPTHAVKEWWPQAEAMVGFFNAYQLSRQPHFLDAAQTVWNYIQQQIIDQQMGEWLWGRNPNGTRIAKEKAGPWKTPYHNGRACMELMQRIEKMTAVKDSSDTPHQS